MANFIATLLVSTVVVNLGLIPFVYSSEQTTRMQRLFAFFVLGIAAWAVAIFGFLQAPTAYGMILCLKLSYVAATAIAASFYTFSLLFPDENRPSRRHLMFVFALSTAQAVALLLPGFLTGAVTVTLPYRVVSLHIPEYLLFATIFCALFLGGLVRLWRKYFAATGIARAQLLAVAGSVSVIGLFGIYYNLVLPSPFFEDFRYVWTGPVLTSLFALVIDYSIFRYHLFRAKVLLAEFLVFALWVIMLVRGLSAQTIADRLGDGLALVIAVPIGVLLLRAMRLEVKTRQALAAANDRLTELDRMKSEFLSFATHQLRGPVTVIRSYVAELEEGSFGALLPDAEMAIGRIGETARSLIGIIDDYLNVSRIEQGRMTYDLSGADIGELAIQTIADFQVVAQAKGLQLLLKRETEQPLLVRMDRDKMGQVVSNLIDNALKYTPKGSVTVSVKRDVKHKSVLLTVKDTGIGIERGEIANLFKKFARAAGAAETARGSGLGLYVAKQLVEGQGGKIWVESDGRGTGTTFFVELPSAQAITASRERIMPASLH